MLKLRDAMGTSRFTALVLIWRLGCEALATVRRQKLPAAFTVDVVKFSRFMGPVEANIPAHYIAKGGHSQALHEDLYLSTPAFGLLRKPRNQPGSATTQEEPSPQANHQLPQ